MEFVNSENFVIFILTFYTSNHDPLTPKKSLMLIIQFDGNGIPQVC